MASGNGQNDFAKDKKSDTIKIRQIAITSSLKTMSGLL
jgi:hypothetical protein